MQQPVMMKYPPLEKNKKKVHFQKKMTKSGNYLLQFIFLNKVELFTCRAAPINNASLQQEKLSSAFHSAKRKNPQHHLLLLLLLPPLLRFLATHQIKCAGTKTIIDLRRTCGNSAQQQRLKVTRVCFLLSCHLVQQNQLLPAT